MMTESSLVQPDLSVPVTLYFEVFWGLATGLLMVYEDNPDMLDHW